MSQVQEMDLTFSAIELLDEGKIAKLLKRHLTQVAQDCVNRPADDSARKVMLQFEFRPILDPDTRECDLVKCEIECKSKVPTFRSKKYEMRVHRSGFAFNADFPDDLDQPSLFPGQPPAASAAPPTDDDPPRSPPAKPR